MSQSGEPQGTGSAPNVREIAREQLARNVGQLIRIGRQQHSAFKNLESPSILTPAQFAVLLALSRVPDIDQRAVSELAALDQSTVSDLVKRLRQRGLVSARPDPHDGRRRILRASAEAVDLVQADGRRLRQADELFLAPLSPAERSWFLRQLRLIAFSRVPDASTRSLPESTDGIAVAETNWAFGRLIRICLQQHAALWAEVIGTVLTPVSHAAVAVLSAAGAAEPGELSEALSLDKASMAALVARMERDDLVKPRPHEHDRRRKVLRVTPRGRDTLKLTAGPAEVVTERLLEPVEEYNRDRVLDVLRQLTFHRAGAAVSPT
ncbi:MarR family winged helix-turn-helix transcriptional regulator [Amycolatopsis rhabdoformis]|uniref:MarR family winged helix-turn-helix transcriptional regulator n=1 Tax=Amycolatopsis rhabdoformis TaxID=1448059 RepID=A0ABZ1IKL9_9PSEU|nr:MarR family winged helix-turn-helix transcriptional regulator [Amycolatopsis rhabdoformis]WSE34326.1 MarR family winged helix-turn-helix transcriptional regulator [Amycolatopsis rhabdoformis]